MKEYIELSQLGKIVTGTTPKTSDEKNYESDDINFYKPGDLDKNSIKLLYESENYISNYAEKSARIVPENSILVTCIGIIGKIGITTKKSSFNQQINAIIPNEKVIPKYLAYAIASIKETMEMKANAPIVPQINKTSFSKFKIPVVDLETQREIVKELDKITEGIDNRTKIINDLDELIKSIYYDSTKGNIQEKKLSEIGESLIGLTYSPNDIAEDGIIVLRSSNIQKGKLDFNDVVRVNTEVKESKFVKENDILICSRNGSKALVGKSALIKNLKEKMTFGAFMSVYRSQYNEFLISFFQSYDFRKQLGGSSTATINQITSNMLNNIKVKLPDNKIIQEASKKISVINELQKLLTDDIEDLKQLLTIKMTEFFK